MTQIDTVGVDRGDTTIIARVCRLTARHLGCEPADVGPDTPFLDLGADSLAMINLLRELEGELGVRVAMRELFEDADTPHRLAHLVATRLSLSNPSAEPVGQPAEQPVVARPSAVEPVPPVKPGPTPQPGPAVAPATVVPSSSGRTATRSDVAAVVGSLTEQLAQMTRQSQEVAAQLAALRPAAAVPPAHQAPTNQFPVHPTTTDQTSTGPAPGDEIGRPADPTSVVTQTDHYLSAAAEVRGPRVVVADNRPSRSERQRAHVAELQQRLVTRTGGSKEIAQRHRRVLADSRAVVGFRSATKEMLYPIAARRASGSWLEDVDGNRYVDITMGFGTLLFGHEPEFLTEAVREHLAGGLRMGPRSIDTGEAAELLSELVAQPRVAFANSGTEANSAAFRLARAATGRSTIVMFHGSYHGHADNMLGRSVPGDDGRVTVPVSIGIPASAVSDLVVLDYGAAESLDAIEVLGSQVAAVVVEPIQSRNPSLRPAEFLTRLREITRRHGMVLMFDEMLTGLRPHPRGAAGIFGVVPDLATYGKALGGGFPIGAIAGRADIMDGIDGGFWQYGDDSRPPRETSFFGGTYIQHPLSMAAARAVLTQLTAQSPDLQDRLNGRTDALAETLNRHFTQEGYPLRVSHFGSLFRFEHRADLELLYHHLLARGVYVWEWRNFFLSTAHSDDDVQFVVDAVQDSLREMRESGFFPRQRAEPKPEMAVPRPAPDFSLYFFGDYPAASAPAEKYAAVLDAARFADERGFHALWMPERHFHSFGGIFPNPVVLAAALAAQTQRVRLNAGSIVLPLHDPIRVAEEWSMVDNLSGGRVGIGCASGWHSNDFVLAPDEFGRHRKTTYQRLDQVRRLWRGEAIHRRNGTGDEVPVRIFPRPVQTQPPMFAAVVGRPESFQVAGEHDLGIVTNLMSQSVEQLADNVARYRKARAAKGLDPQAGRVVVLVHTYIGEDAELARRQAFAPLREYMRSSLSLFGQVANSLGVEVDVASMRADDLDYVFERAYERYCSSRALIGGVADCAAVVDKLIEAGVDEVAALVDFGVSPEQMLAGLPELDRLRRHCQADTPPAPAPLSPGQRRIWFLDRLFPGRSTYNEPVAIRLDGNLEATALRAALDALVARHPALRTVFREVDGEPLQVVLPPSVAALTIADAQGQDIDGLAADAIAAESRRIFDLAVGPLFVSRLLRIAADRWLLVLNFHHIVVDAVSARVIARDLSQLYRAKLHGHPAQLPILRRTYPEFARDQLAALDGEQAATDLAYWTVQLGGELPILALPTARPRPAVQTSHGRSLTRRLDPALSTELRELAGSHRATLFMVLLSGFAATLARFSGQDEVVVGTPVADRPTGADDVVGFFLNNLALRLDLAGDPAFDELLRRVRATALDAYDHAGAPFEAVVRSVGPPRDTARNPLFQVIVEFESEPAFPFDLPGVTAVPLEVAGERAVVDLALYLGGDAGDSGIACRLEYNTDLFHEDFVARLLDYFAATLGAAVAEPRTPLSRLVGLTDTDRQTLDQWGRGPVRPVPDERLEETVRRQARMEPDRIAVIGGGTALTYGELDAASVRLAVRLRRIGVGPGDVVALLLPRSPDLIVAMLAVAQAGAAYLPLDVDLGPARLRFMLADSGACAVVTSAGMPAVELPTGIPAVRLDEPGPTDGEIGNVDRADADGPCYVIYTSGSTGQPKGVVVSHRNVRNICEWFTHEYALSAADRCAVVCAHSFDGSVLEIWPALLAGASLTIAEDHVRLDTAALARWFRSSGAGFTLLPTTLGEALLALPAAEQPPLRGLLIGGDQLRVRPRRDVPYRVDNVYGPTEATVVTTFARVDPDGDLPVPIGRPVDNARAHVLDASGRPAPLGVPGELHIGGAGVSKGYLHRPDLTAQRYVTNASDERLYRTGDLVRWCQSGDLQFLGRVDDQVKIRGFRVEPGEVTVVLRGLGLVADAVVVATRDRAQAAYLVGYLVPKSGEPVDDLADRVANALADRLPEHLVPRAWAVLPALPLTGNGKLDRAALPLVAPRTTVSPSVDSGAAADSGTAPSSDPTSSDADAAEQTVRALWSAELEVDPDRVPATSSFFSVGGDSINAMRLLNRFRDATGVDYTALRFFRAPTLAAMAGHLRSLGGPAVNGDSSARNGHGQIGNGCPDRTCAPLSYQQERMMQVLDRTDSGIGGVAAARWNVGFQLELTGTLDVPALQSAVDLVRGRHHALRTRFGQHDGTWRQHVMPYRPTELPVVDLVGAPSPERRALAIERCRELADQGFDLVRADPIRVELIRLDEHESWLVLVLHHVACDGWAVSVLLRELAAAYRHSVGAGPALPPPPIQYTDYARRQRSQLDDKTREPRLAYWTERLRDASFTLELPFDRPVPTVPSGRGATLEFPIAGATLQAVEELTAARGQTGFAITLAALAALLARLGGRDEVTLSVPYANRDRLETDALVGLTAIPVLLRIRVDDAGTFGDLVEQCAAALSAAVDHLTPIAWVYERLAQTRADDIPIAPAISFAYQNTLDLRLDLPGLAVEVGELPAGASAGGLLFVLVPRPGRLDGTFCYPLDRLDDATAERWMAAYTRLLTRACQAPGQSLGALLAELDQPVGGQPCN